MTWKEEQAYKKAMGFICESPEEEEERDGAGSGGGVQ